MAPSIPLPVPLGIAPLELFTGSALWAFDKARCVNYIFALLHARALPIGSMGAPVTIANAACLASAMSVEPYDWLPQRANQPDLRATQPTSMTHARPRSMLKPGHLPWQAGVRSISPSVSFPGDVVDLNPI